MRPRLHAEDQLGSKKKSGSALEIVPLRLETPTAGKLYHGSCWNKHVGVWSLGVQAHETEIGESLH